MKQLNSTYQLDFAQTPYSNGVWFQDTPNKNTASNDPSLYNQSLQYLDTAIFSNGPYEALLGYSQGAAMVHTYLAFRTNTNVKAGLMFNGYTESLHTTVVQQIQSVSPLNKKAFIYYGTQDSFSSATMITQFIDPVVVSREAGHSFPNNVASEVFQFLQKNILCPIWKSTYNTDNCLCSSECSFIEQNFTQHCNVC